MSGIPNEQRQITWQGILGAVCWVFVAMLGVFCWFAYSPHSCSKLTPAERSLADWCLTEGYSDGMLKASVREFGARQTRAALRSLLRHPDDRIRICSVNVLGYDKDPEAVSILFDALKSGDGGVPFHAAQGLRNIGGDRVVEWQMEALAERGDIEAADFLSRHSGPEEERRLTTLMRTAEPRRRYAAAVALCLREKPSAAPVVLTAFEADPCASRAVDALGRCGGPEAVEPLRGALRDKKRCVNASDVWSSIGSIRRRHSKGVPATAGH